MVEETARLVFPVEDRAALSGLAPGARVLVSGTIYTARDAAHARLRDEVARGDRDALPFPSGSCVYYAGPATDRAGRITAIGPTTAARMDPFAPLLYELGVAATIGKGPRSDEVAAACARFGALYLVTYGGAASFLASRVRAARVFLYRDLGPEAVYELEVVDFPAYVGIDARGRAFEPGV